MLSWPFDFQTNCLAWSLDAGQYSAIQTNTDSIMLIRNGAYVELLRTTNSWRFESGGQLATNIFLQPGEGFFYTTKGTNFTWAPQNPNLF